MKKYLKSDLEKRLSFKNQELSRTALLYFSKDGRLGAETPLQVTKTQSRMLKRSAPSVVKNRCLETGMGRSVQSKFRLSRSSLRNAFNFALFSGVKKSSWLYIFK